MISIQRPSLRICLVVIFCTLLVPVAALAAGNRTRNKPVAQRKQNSARDDYRAGKQGRPGWQQARSIRPRRMSAQELRAERRRAALEQAYAARRREEQRLAAIARQRAIDDAARNQVQSMIARDDIRGEDPEVRRVAVSALGNHAGTVVVMDPRTGRIYTIVNQDWAMRRGFKPCSTIKLVTGVAGLNEGVIDPVDTTKASAAYHINLTDALAYSNNTYFQQVGGRVGFEKMVSYARQMGLGQKTGINAPNESAGSLPSFKSGFAVNHMSSHGDNFQVTALQLATMVSAMANGGKLLVPYVPHTPAEEAKLKPKVRRKLDIDPQTLTYMVPGMIGSVSYGSGKRAYNPQETVAGKTGTCIGDGGWVGLFTSYAPLANPRLAVVVIAQGVDAHGHFPAAVAGRIYRDLSSRFGTPTNLQIANKRRATAADPKAALDEENDEAESDNADNATIANIPTDAAGAASKTVGPQTKPAPSRVPVNNNVRRVLMPIPSGNREAAKPLTRPEPQPAQRPRRVTGN